jgi:catechol 2,3-dioxygenase
MAYTAHPDTRVGHIHLKVSDLERSIAYYRDVLGFDLKLRYGKQAAFLAAGDYHHHIGLNTWESAGGTAPAARSTGMYHVAFLYPNRAALGAAIRSVLANGGALDGAADHGVSEAVYLRDPDGNGIELYRDRPFAEWPRDASGEHVEMINAPLDVQAILAEAD